MKRILLGLMPFWKSLIPPLSLACLKSYIQNEDYEIKTCNANIDNELIGFYTNYFSIFKDYMPPEKLGNIYNLGNDLLEHHLTLVFNGVKDEVLDESVKTIIYHNYYISASETLIKKLNILVYKYYNYIESYIDDLITEFNPDIIGLTIYRGTLASTLYVLRYVKRKCPEIKTIIGGPIFSQELVPDSPNFDAFIEEISFIDSLFIGEGEIMLKKYLNGQIPSSQKVICLRDVDDQLMNIDDVPLPSFNADTLGFYLYLPIYTSRGCPYKCSFCAETVNWVKYRKKKPNHIYHDMANLNQQYNKKLFLLADSLINPVVDGLADVLCDIDASYFYDGYLKIDRKIEDAKIVEKWAKSGFYRARLGIESGSQRVLDSMEKKINIAQIKTSLINLAEAGIKTSTYWIVGYPGETESDFLETLDLITEMKNYIYEAECNPFRYFYSGQVGSDDWGTQFKNTKMYSPEIQKKLLYQTWILETEPNREEIYNRVCRFEEHTRKNGVPNPYTLKDIFMADERWKSLHSKAVPNIFDIL